MFFEKNNLTPILFRNISKKAEHSENQQKENANEQKQAPEKKPDEHIEEINYKIFAGTDKIDICLALIKNDFLHAEDDLKELSKNHKDKFPIIVATDKDKFNIIDKFFNLYVSDVFFDFMPEKILENINEIINKKPEAEDKQNTNYIIDFYDNKQLFIVDISGPILKEKVTGLKLMFYNFLKEKLKTLKGIVYIFSNINESTILFKNIWPLIKIWNDMNINYKNVAFLSNSKKLTSLIEKYFKKYGMNQFPNLLEISKYFFPELAKKNEMELFEFSAQILSSPRKIAGK